MISPIRGLFARFSLEFLESGLFPNNLNKQSKYFEYTDEALLINPIWSGMPSCVLDNFAIFFKIAIYWGVACVFVFEYKSPKLSCLLSQACAHKRMKWLAACNWKSEYWVRILVEFMNSYARKLPWERYTYISLFNYHLLTEMPLQI